MYACDRSHVRADNLSFVYNVTVKVVKLVKKNLVAVSNRVFIREKKALLALLISKYLKRQINVQNERIKLRFMYRDREI